MTNTHSVRIEGSSSTLVDPVFINVLIHKLTPFIEFKSYSLGKRFTISATRQNHCYIVRSGAVSLVRQPDDILVDLLDAPTMRGIIPVHASSLSVHTLRVIEPAEIAIIEQERLSELLTQLQLWDVFAKHLQLVASAAAEVMFKLVSPSVFNIVRLQLYELMDRPQHIRESISAEKYIRGKTLVSRSAIMRVLSDLKTGGYISIENGILKGIKYIPDKY